MKSASSLDIREHENRKAYRYIWLNYLVDRAYEWRMKERSERRVNIHSLALNQCENY